MKTNTEILNATIGPPTRGKRIVFFYFTLVLLVLVLVGLGLTIAFLDGVMLMVVGLSLIVKLGFIGWGLRRMIEWRLTHGSF